ncbi:LCP family protein [Garciella nitratireducens]|nr:LCP family protein [Garciella nitratireducens]RBP37820.1 LytR family transcriptional attenuator [Garciella nitratireducens]
MKHGKKKNKRKYLIPILFVIVSILGVTFGTFYAKMRNPQSLFASSQNNKIDIADQFNKDIINIMLVGFDKDQQRSKESKIFRTDTNIVLTINLEKKTVDMISIPRDSYVSIANANGMDKFNSAYGYGYLNSESKNPEDDGFQCIMDTASKLLGEVPIYYYAAVDMDVVVEIVDAIGGVEINVPTDLYKDHGKDQSEIVIHKGQQKLDGEGLLYYARYRHYPKGDIQRVENQQKILLATFGSLKKSNMFSSLPKIYESVQKNIKTNLNTSQIAALALFAKDLNKESIHTYMMPGDFGTINNLSYWIIDQEKRVQLIQDLYGITIEPDEKEIVPENLTSIEASISRNILEIGQTAQIKASGVTNLGNQRLFDPGDLRYSSSNANIITVSDNGVVTAVGAGNATITISVDGISKNINITVNAAKVIEKSKQIEQPKSTQESNLPKQTKQQPKEQQQPKTTQQKQQQPKTTQQKQQQPKTTQQKQQQPKKETTDTDKQEDTEKESQELMEGQQQKNNQ